MKTIFAAETLDELTERLGKLSPESTRQWGKMSPAQMTEHCYRAMHMATGKDPVKQALLGKMLSWAFKSGFLGEKPFPKNSPTGPDFIIKDEPDLEPTKEKLRVLMAEFHALGEGGTDGNVHRFFGPLTGKQWGETQYKHLDHHLRQFGV